jgi:hypothetical protein
MRPTRIRWPARADVAWSGIEQLGLGRGEFVVGQDPLLVQVRELIQLVDHGRGRSRRWRWRLLLLVLRRRLLVLLLLRRRLLLLLF